VILINEEQRCQHTTSGLAKLGAEVIVRISVCPLTVSVSPNCVQLTPQLRQAAGTLCASGGQRSTKIEIENLKSMNYRAIIFGTFYVIATTLNAQTEFLTESENDLFWQPNVKINFSHYQAEGDTACVKYYEKYGLSMASSIGVRGVVDVPKTHLSRKIRKRKGDDKSYLAPVFCKNCSCKLSEDSLILKVDQLLFDVAEMCARGARKELFDTKNEMKINNVNAMFFTTIKNSWDERMRGTFGSIIRDVLIEKKEGAYAEWRQLIDELLEKNESFATHPEDIHRHILGKPIEKDYVMPNNIMGDLRSRSEK